MSIMLWLPFSKVLYLNYHEHSLQAARNVLKDEGKAKASIFLNVFHKMKDLEVKVSCHCHLKSLTIMVCEYFNCIANNSKEGDIKFNLSPQIIPLLSLKS